MHMCKENDFSKSAWIAQKLAETSNGQLALWSERLTPNIGGNEFEYTVCVDRLGANKDPWGQAFPQDTVFNKEQ